MPNQPTKASEELLAAPLPALIRDLGLAIATANKELAKVEGKEPVIYVINRAEIDISVAIAIEKAQSTEAGGSLNLHAFSVNASYLSTYAFREQAASRIKVELQARCTPAEKPPQA